MPDPASNPAKPPPLSDADVRKVAALARLALTDEQIAGSRADLAGVLGYMDRLGALDLTGVEPMTTPVEQVNRLGADEPGPVLPNAALMSMAPATAPPYVTVPKVLGEGSGA